MPDKLQKPYPTFPLTPNASGRGWNKKYKGHQLFIAERDPNRALRKFHRLARRIDDGEYDPGERQKFKDDATVYDVVNRYVAERKADVAAGKLSQGAWDDYDDAGADMMDAFGEDSAVDALGPDDFTRLYRKMSKRLGAHALGRFVQSCRTIWNHAEENNWIRRRPRFGSVFRKPTTEKKAGRPFTLAECRVLVAFAGGLQLEAMLLLMLNGGYTAKDCADLPRSAVDLDLGVVRFPRPKMRRRRAVDRVMVLWPETAEALAEVMAERPDDALVFRTIHGNPWVNGQTDSVGLMFRRLVGDLIGHSADKKGRSPWSDAGGPSWLRHVHRTIADELEKPHAAARLMGHRLPGLAEVYVDKIEHVRVQEITDHVRARLWPAAARRTPGAPSETSPAPAAP